MSLKSDDLDLNSDVVPAEQNDDVDPSESAVRVDVPSTTETLASSPLGAGRVGEGLGTPDGGGSIGEAKMGLVDGGNGGKLADSSGGEIGGNDGGFVLGLKGNFRSTDAYCGDSNPFPDKNEGVEKNSSAFCERAVVDGSGEGISVRIEVEGEVSTGDGIQVCKEGESGSAGLQPVEEEPNNGAGGGVVNPDLASRDTDPILITVDSGPSVAEAVPDDSGIGAADELANKEMRVEMLADVDENKGLGDVTGGAADELANKEMKVDMLADVDENKGLGDVTGVSQHAAVGDTDSHVHGIGLDGNQDLVIKEQAKDIEHRQDVLNKNVKKAAFRPKDCRTEKEGEFRASDLVWGKVRSHPWWPGQVLDPSDSTEMARRYSRKDGFLIAYFGDQTFAWNDASRIKPFRAHFSQMEKQSNSEAFHRAVDCALDEVSRRMEFGLSCSCVSKEVYDKIKTQVIVNAGIREESCIRDGGDEFSSVSSFMPVNLVRYLKAAAESPFGGTNRLEFVVARAQLLAFKRWKGCYQLPEFKILGSWEEEDDIPVLGEREDSKGVSEHGIDFSEDNVQVPVGKVKSVIWDSSSRKRKDICGDGLPPSKKEKRMSDLMSQSHSNLSNSGTKPKEKAEMKLTPLSSAKKRKAGDSGSDDSKMKNSLSPVTKRQFSRVGESMCRVASKLAASTPILKDVSGKSIGENGSNKRSRISSEGSQRRKVVPAEYPPPEDILSQLCVAARDPVQEYSFSISVISFLSDYRNSFCLENSTTRRKSTGKKSSNSVTTETSWFEGIEDSYWTDRIVQSNPDEQAVFELETPIKKGSPTVEPEAALESSPKLDSKQETAVVNLESAKPAGHMDEKCEEEYTPTALILNFSDLDSVPSESNLNKVFSRYGPINELDTEVPKKSKRAKVVFKRRADAENAFSSPGKFNIFGSALVSYRLSYLPSTSASKASKKVATSLDKNAT